MRTKLMNRVEAVEIVGEAAVKTVDSTAVTAVESKGSIPRQIAYYYQAEEEDLTARYILN